MTRSLTALSADPTGAIEDAPTTTGPRWRRLATRAAIVGAVAGGAWLLGSALGSTSASAATITPPSPPASQVVDSGASPVANLVPVVTQSVNATITSAANQTVGAAGAVVLTATAPLPVPISGTVASLVTTSTGAVGTTSQALNSTITSTTEVLTTTVDAASTVLTTATGSLATVVSVGDNTAGSVGALVLGYGSEVFPADMISAPVSASTAVFAAVVHGQPMARAVALSAVTATLAVGIAGVGVAGFGGGTPNAPAPPAPGGPSPSASSSSAFSAFDRVLNRSWRAVAGLFGLIVTAAVAAGCTLFYDSPAFSPD